MKSQESQPDRNRRSDDYESEWAGWTDFWETPRGLLLALFILVVLAGVLLFGKLGSLGIWEPWEANEILVAQEYQDRPAPPPPEELGPKESSYNWAVPTKDQEPISRSLLKIWLVSWSLAEGASSSGQPTVGSLELSARLPLAFGVLILALVGFFWLRDVFDTWSALLATGALLSTPALYVGAHTLSAETLYVVSTSIAIIAFAKLVFTDGPMEYLWGGAFGAGLALSFLDQRFFGALVPLAVITAFGLTQLPYRQATEIASDDGDPPIGLYEKLLAAGAIVAGGGFAGWGFWVSAGARNQLLLPHIEQLFAVFLPLFVLLAGLLLAWRTRVVRTLRSPAGLLGLALFAAAAVPVLEAYADANPTLLKHGNVLGTIPVLEFILTNDLYGAGPSGDHPHFAMWFRQVGFSMVPWVAFVPLALGYLADATRLTDETGAIRDGVVSERDSARRLLLVWSFVGVLVVGGASLYGHYYIPVYFPLIAGVGLMLGDDAFWRRARLDSLLQYFMGFAAIAVLLMFAKDLERFPPRLLEPFMMFEEDLGLPDDFSYGELLDRLKYGWLLLSGVFFFGLATRALHDKYRDVTIPAGYFALLAGLPFVWGPGAAVVYWPSAAEWATPAGVSAIVGQAIWFLAVAGLPVLYWLIGPDERDEYLFRCTAAAGGLGLGVASAAAFVFGGQPSGLQVLGSAVFQNPAKLASLALTGVTLGGTAVFLVKTPEIVAEWIGRRWSNFGDLFDDEGTPLRERALEKEQFRRQSDFFGLATRIFEAPQTFGALLLVVFSATGGVFLYEILPRIGNHLSQRGIFETYTEIREDEKLYRLRVSTRETSVYLRDVPRLESTSEFLEKFDASERFFAVIPRDQLSSLNTRVRKRYGRDIPVLDARSSQILLVSNKLEEDEENQNFIADAIVEDRSEIQHETTFQHKGKAQHPVFDNRIKLLGYSLDHAGETPSYSWGETARLTTYFEVERPVSTNQKIFLHVDYPGSRIHGDHYPMGGDFPTGDWPEGMIVKDVYDLKIDPYSSTGEYTMFFGFYRAGQRMSVRPPSAHDGQNRVPMGKIRVTGF